MKTVFRYRLARLRGQILGWGIGMGLYALLMVQFYETVVQQKEQLEQLIQNYPKEMMAFFGAELDNFATPSGYLSIEFFSYTPLIVGIFAVVIGSSLLVSDEENGRLDLILAHPVSRRALFWGRLAAFMAATLAITALIWVGLVVPSRWTPLDEASIVALTQPFLPLLAQLIFFGVLALLLSLLLPSRRMAAMTSGLVLVGSFLLLGLSRINTDLEPFARLTPLYYYQGGEAIEGLKMSWVVGLLVVALAFALLAWWRFERRDIRVGGEGGWGRPSLRALGQLLPRRSAV